MPVTLLDQVKTIIDVFSPKDKRSEIVFRPDKPSTGGFLMDISNAREELGYVPQYDCRKLFEDYREEMKVNRFLELRQMSI
jgi:UDP-glucose 4-epimerase